MRQAVRITTRNSGLVIFLRPVSGLGSGTTSFTVAGAVLDFREFPDSRVSTHLKTWCND